MSNYSHIAFLGLGRMGAPMAARLVEAGHRVTGWNRTPRPLPGAAVAATAAEAVADADLVITMLSDPAAVQEVLGSVRPRPGTLVVEMSTIGPEAVARVRALLPADVDLVDAPVLGSVQPAAAGELVILAGGNVTPCREVLEVFGVVREAGPLGAGAALKLAVMSAIVPAQVLLAETLAYAEAQGVDQGLLLDVLEGTMLAGVAVRLRPVAESGPPEPRYALRLAAKDLVLASHEVQTLAGAARDRLLRAAGDGFADHDVTAIVQAARTAPAPHGNAARTGPVRINPATVPPTNGRYSHAVRSGNLLFVSGQVALDADGAVVGEGDMTRQAEFVFDCLERILADQGCTFGDITFIRTHLTDMDLLEEYAEVRTRRITGEPPASTTVEVPRLFRPGLLIEIDVVAAVPGA
ncbi:hypothetical protein Misp01_61710 [Microtetraspora sp. NBRC 13810]|uniref:NAD(P)-binding domain-containing protein n=1 Tax=Microtetraspora sp. NBRC 13810 TaxID=3030990 RepID=UPI0024A0E82C|nr:NAD(P)-binding domain-containing protein [Microtetraspora sp. NBRC 13810]GLW11043.1 hypothetical protein Misp01_61710 [Microtetraspora sp. NBRC 13810]